MKFTLGGATAIFNTPKIYLEGATVKFNTRETYLVGATAKFNTRETQKFRSFFEPRNLVPAKFSTFIFDIEYLKLFDERFTLQMYDKSGKSGYKVHSLQGWNKLSKQFMIYFLSF